MKIFTTTLITIASLFSIYPTTQASVETIIEETKVNTQANNIYSIGYNYYLPPIARVIEDNVTNQTILFDGQKINLSVNIYEYGSNKEITEVDADEEYNGGLYNIYITRTSLATRIIIKTNYSQVTMNIPKSSEEYFLQQGIKLILSVQVRLNNIEAYNESTQSDNYQIIDLNANTNGAQALSISSQTTQTDNILSIDSESLLDNTSETSYKATVKKR